MPKKVATKAPNKAAKKKTAKKTNTTKPAAPVTPKVTATNSVFQQPNQIEVDFDTISIMVHGPVGGGKTTFAFSISKYFPKDFPRKKGSKTIVLKDTIQVGIDNGSIDGLLAQGIKPGYFVNLPRLLAPYSKKELQQPEAQRRPQASDIMDAIDMVVDGIYDIIESDPEVENVVIDTVSRLDKYMLNHWRRPENMPKTQAGKNDTRGMYGELLISHQNFESEIMCLPIRKIFLAHTKATSGDGNEETKNRRALQDGTQKVEAVPAITGQGGDGYIQDSSLEVVIKPDIAPSRSGGKKIKTYYAYTDVVDASGVSMRTKNRFEEALDFREPAHLGKIMQKIRAYTK